MPVYEYLCNDCGPFTDMRPMAECDDPQDCPRCETQSPRVLLTAPNCFCMPSDRRKAHATNERSTHAPHVCGAGCSHGAARSKPAGTSASGRDRPALQTSGKENSRPWMLGH